jgi:O-antigen/teichoic acid export membrane protein
VFERRGEIVFLALFSADAEIALFAIPFSAVAVLALAPYALGTVTSTAYATLLGAGELGRIVSGYGRSLRLALLVTLPLTAIGVAAGPSVLSAVYGSEYDGAKPVLAILVAGLPLVVATSLAISLLQGLGRVRRQVAVFAAAAVANVALCLALVPRLDAIGAAIAHTVAYAVAALFAAGAAHRALPDVDARLVLLGRTAVAAAGAGALAVAVALPVHDAALAAVAALGVGTVGFVLLARALRIVPADDAEWLRSALGHRFGGRAGRVVSAFSPLAERT